VKQTAKCQLEREIPAICEKDAVTQRRGNAVKKI